MASDELGADSSSSGAVATRLLKPDKDKRKTLVNNAPFQQEEYINNLYKLNIIIHLLEEIQPDKDKRKTLVNNAPFQQEYMYKQFI